jgi:hypothetical protein
MLFLATKALLKSRMNNRPSLNHYCEEDYCLLYAEKMVFDSRTIIIVLIAHIQSYRCTLV